MKKQKADRAIETRTINQLPDGAARIGGLTVAPPLGLQSTPNGPLIYWAGRSKFTAQLSGGTSPYSWSEVYPTSGGSFVSASGSRSGTSNAYEVNSVSGLSGKVVELVATAANDYRFQLIRNGSSSFISQPSCPCPTMPATLHFSGHYVTIFGPAGRDPTSLGCPTAIDLTAQTRPSGFQVSSIVANNTVWMSTAFNYTYYVFNPATGQFDIAVNTTQAVIIYWCQPQNGHITCQIYDAGNSYGGANALLLQNGDTSTTHFQCSPFLWNYSPVTSTWTGNSTLSA